MPTLFVTFILFLLLAMVSSNKDMNPVHLARFRVLKARNSVKDSMAQISLIRSRFEHRNVEAALSDCAELYENSDSRLDRLLYGPDYTAEDARTWLSGAVANHRSCLDGLKEVGGATEVTVAESLTNLLSDAMGLYEDIAVMNVWNETERVEKQISTQNGGINLAKWNPATSKADYVVAIDGSGTHRTINGAVVALAKRRRGRRGRSKRVVVYVKAGVYKENVEIGREMKNVMMVGDGIDKTIVTGNRNVPDGATTYGSATFGVSGDGFWARDMTFENTAGPHKYQAVALRVNSDLSIFYKCSFKGYQDTLFLHSLRQFYRDCQIYGTIDFIFGDATSVIQNSDIIVRKPMNHQANMITAQARDDPRENTGIFIDRSRVIPAPDLAAVTGRFKTYLGRPWKRYSRTVFMMTDLDGLIDPKGWGEWEGSFALSTLYYGEYRNFGKGSSTRNRVKWPGFHVLRSFREVRPFTVAGFLHGDVWIPVTGVPFHAGIEGFDD